MVEEGFEDEDPEYARAIKESMAHASGGVLPTPSSGVPPVPSHI